jgi:XTP/dITP diphosphohydrolase
MTPLLLASNNPGKLVEMQALLDGLPIQLQLPRELGLDLHVPEDGLTYAENAALKARAFCRASGLLTLADDSGLEVDALGGQPGLYSARFAPPDFQGKPDDSTRRRYLLQRLRGLPPPWSAHFHATVAIAIPGADPPQIYFAEGNCYGEIIPEERGSSGFGYDPIFLLPEMGLTMAELSAEEKNHLSHRAHAILAALPLLKKLLQIDG